MSRVTTHARGVVQELVERRLWPVAVLLLAAVLAVPVLLGGDEQPPGAAPVTEAQTAVAAGADDGAQITIVESTPPRRKRAGRVRNPFVQPTEKQTADTAAETPSAPSAAAPTAGASSASAAGGLTTVSQGADTGAAGAGSAGSQPTRPTTTTTTRRVVHNDPRDDVFRVDLRFGTGPGSMRVAKDVARLTPLPSAADPLFVFLGVLKDGKTVVFLLPPGARSEGEGTCRPKARDCRLLEVRTDETQIVEIAGADGKRQFVVRVTGVKRSEAKTAARAAAAHARVSQAGQELLREADADKGTDPFDAFRFRPDLGVLVRVPRRATAAAAGTRSGEVVVWRTRAARG